MYLQSYVLPISVNEILNVENVYSIQILSMYKKKYRFEQN